MSFHLGTIQFLQNIETLKVTPPSGEDISTRKLNMTKIIMSMEKYVSMDDLMEEFYKEVDVLVHFNKDHNWELYCKGHKVIRHKANGRILSSFNEVSSCFFTRIPLVF